MEQPRRKEVKKPNLRTGGKEQVDGKKPAKKESCCEGLNGAIQYYFLNAAYIADPLNTGDFTPEQFAPRGQLFLATVAAINALFRDTIAKIRDKCVDPECCEAMAYAIAEAALGAITNAYNVVLSSSFPTANLQTFLGQITSGLQATADLILTTGNKPNCCGPCGGGCGNNGGCSKYVIRA